MKEHTSTQKEKRFVLLTLLTAAACAALVFWFAVPLKGHTGQTAQPEPMIQAARVFEIRKYNDSFYVLTNDQSVAGYIFGSLHPNRVWEFLYNVS